MEYVYDGRIFTEEYFIEKLGEGLPEMAYILLAERANQIHYRNECHNKITQRKDDIECISNNVSSSVLGS